MGETPLVGPWQVAHCASSGWTAWVLRSQFPVPVLQTAPEPKLAHWELAVQALPEGLPKTRGGWSVPVSKKTLSWQVPQACR